MWLATIKPTFDQKAYLMVLHNGNQSRALFRKGGPPGLVDVENHSFECSGLDDKLVSTLRHVDLCPSRTDWVLDGIGYELRIRSSAVSADLKFSNPRTDSLRAVERALFSVATNIAHIAGCSDLSDYLPVWSKYLR
jgi:hypothetical protein